MNDNKETGADLATLKQPPAGKNETDESNKENNADKSKPTAGGYDVPWVERYRPKTLDDVVGNEDTLVRLRAIAKNGNMPNLILCGPPGTGKVRQTENLHCIYATSTSG